MVVLRAAAVLLAVLLILALAPPDARADRVRDAMMPVLEQLNVPEAWKASKGEGVTVAVLDSGVDADQPDLTGSVTVGPDYTEGANPRGVPPSRLHGTTMASIIAGHGHGPGRRSGIVGVAPEAAILSLRVILERDEPGFDRFNGAERYEKTIAKGIRYAVDHGADVINLSLGRSYPTRAEREAVAYAIGRGVVVVAAAGNRGDRRARHPEYAYPASFPGVISVAAVDARGAHAGFSNRNTAIVVSAPGVRIIGAGPGGRYWIGDGTSPATAFVAGIAALVRGAHPDLPPALVTQAIVAGTRVRPDGGYDRAVGFGRVDALAALTEAGALAGSRPEPGRDAGKSFGRGASGPVEVVHHPPGLIAVCLAALAMAASGLTVIALRGRRSPALEP